MANDNYHSDDIPQIIIPRASLTFEPSYFLNRDFDQKMLDMGAERMYVPDFYFPNPRDHPLKLSEDINSQLLQGVYIQNASTDDFDQLDLEWYGSIQNDQEFVTDSVNRGDIVSLLNYSSHEGVQSIKKKYLLNRTSEDLISDFLESSGYTVEEKEAFMNGLKDFEKEKLDDLDQELNASDYPIMVKESLGAKSKVTAHLKIIELESLQVEMNEFFSRKFDPTHNLINHLSELQNLMNRFQQTASDSIISNVDNCLQNLFGISETFPEIMRGIFLSYQQSNTISSLPML